MIEKIEVRIRRILDEAFSGQLFGYYAHDLLVQELVIFGAPYGNQIILSPRKALQRPKVVALRKIAGDLLRVGITWCEQDRQEDC